MSILISQFSIPSFLYNFTKHIHIKYYILFRFTLLGNLHKRDICSWLSFSLLHHFWDLFLLMFVTEFTDFHHSVCLWYMELNEYLCSLFFVTHIFSMNILVHVSVYSSLRILQVSSLNRKILLFRICTSLTLWVIWNEFSMQIKKEKWSVSLQVQFSCLL